ncbi:hypothetical protein DFJ77DRAFT_457805 [Powellomyces hirtus]|nr:hypothetical protein DFJ77DRAFT_457805 [Powellomyces hirtus]
MSSMSLLTDALPTPSLLQSDVGFLDGGTDSQIATPTRFLQECVNFKFTPGLITSYISGNFNPFELSFNEKLDDPMNTNMSSITADGITAATTADANAAVLAATGVSLTWNATNFSNPSEAFPRANVATVLPTPSSSPSTSDSTPIPITTSPPVAPAGENCHNFHASMYGMANEVPDLLATGAVVSQQVLQPHSFGLQLPAKRQRIQAPSTHVNLVDSLQFPNTDLQFHQQQHQQQQLSFMETTMQIPLTAQQQFQRQQAAHLVQQQQQMYQHQKSHLEHTIDPLAVYPSSVAPGNLLTNRRASAISTTSTLQASPVDQKRNIGSSEDGSDLKPGIKRRTPPTEEEQDDKRKRFLERNRLAASKCRMKKKQWLQDLEVKSAEVGQTNRQLQAIISQLKEEVMVLKSQLLLHQNCTCNVIQQYISTSPQFSQQPPNAPPKNDGNAAQEEQLQPHQQQQQRHPSQQQSPQRQQQLEPSPSRQQRSHTLSPMSGDSIPRPMY